MHIEKLSLINFKNYEAATFYFDPRVNCLTGLNGSGKTNVLDALHYLSFTKSAINAVDKYNVGTAETFFSVKGQINVQDKNHEVLCSFQNGQKKLLKVDRKEYDKLSDHIGRFPVVFVSPDDTDLIREGSEVRRRFFDALISQTDQEYLHELIQYNRNLKQRNGYLKNFVGRGSVNRDLMENYNQVLSKLGHRLAIKRQKFVEELTPVFNNSYEELSSGREKVELAYRSDAMKGPLEEQLWATLQRDLMLERTTVGVHKDDFKFMIEGQPLKKFGSQGQQKSYVLGLRLAQFEVIYKARGIKPVLLFDDIFDKLDRSRIDKLVNFIAGERFGQVFITDANGSRLHDLLAAQEIGYKNFIIERGEIANEIQQ